MQCYILAASESISILFVDECVISKTDAVFVNKLKFLIFGLKCLSAFSKNINDYKLFPS
jgi:hypothetical protein